MATIERALREATPQQLAAALVRHRTYDVCECGECAKCKQRAYRRKRRAQGKDIGTKAS